METKNAATGSNVLDFGNEPTTLTKTRALTENEKDAIRGQLSQSYKDEYLSKITVAINGKSFDEFLSDILKALSLTMQVVFQTTGSCKDPTSVNVDLVRAPSDSESYELEVLSIPINLEVRREITGLKQQQAFCGPCTNGIKGTYFYRDFLLTWNVRLAFSLEKFGYGTSKIALSSDVNDSMRVCTPCCCGESKKMTYQPVREYTMIDEGVKPIPNDKPLVKN